MIKYLKLIAYRFYLAMWMFASVIAFIGPLIVWFYSMATYPYIGLLGIPAIIIWIETLIFLDIRCGLYDWLRPKSRGCGCERCRAEHKP